MTTTPIAPDAIAARPARGRVAPWLLARLTPVWHEHRALAVIALLFWAVLALVGPVADWPGPVGPWQRFVMVTRVAAWVLIPAIFAQIWCYRHRLRTSGGELSIPRAWAAAARECYARDLTLSRALSFAVAAFLSTLVTATFTGWKQAFPTVAPFAWDATFMQMDRFLHLGRLPHEWLAPVLARPDLVRAWDRFYVLSWFGVVVLAFALACLAKPSPLRRQFLIANALAWVVLGTIAATALSSAGPWAYGIMVDGPDPYATFMARLRAIHAGGHLISLDAQKLLYDAHVADPPRVLGVGGISAMPSLHVGMATLIAVASWRAARWVGVLATLYALAILVGSVLSAMHYAVDGYVASVGVLVIWWLAGVITRSSRAGTGGPARNPSGARRRSERPSP